MSVRDAAKTLINARKLAAPVPSAAAPTAVPTMSPSAAHGLAPAAPEAAPEPAPVDDAVADMVGSAGPDTTGPDVPAKEMAAAVALLGT